MSTRHQGALPNSQQPQENPSRMKGVGKVHQCCIPKAVLHITSIRSGSCQDQDQPQSYKHANPHKDVSWCQGRHAALMCGHVPVEDTWRCCKPTGSDADNTIVKDSMNGNLSCITVKGLHLLEGL